MGKTTFIICDEEKDYSEKLYEYIHAGESGRFDVLLFTDIGQLNEYLVSSKAGIILISGMLLCMRIIIENNIDGNACMWRWIAAVAVCLASFFVIIFTNIYNIN